MPNLYVISGCNGAGKTTASYSVLPDMLNCKEFVNADETNHVQFFSYKRIIIGEFSRALGSN